MKISISNIAWDRAEDAAVAGVMQSLGVRGLDCAPTKITPTPLQATDEEIDAYRQFWANHGIQMVGVQSLIYGRPDLALFGGEAARSEMREYLSGIIRFAARLGAKPLVFGSPKNRLKGELGDDEAMAVATEFFAALAEIAHVHNTIICIEPNPPEYGCDFIRTTAEALALVKRVNHPGLRLNLDAAIMIMNDEPIEASLDSAIEWLGHFHISEPQLGVVGEGMVDHARFAAHLRRLGYGGWLAVEMRSGWKTPDVESVRTALKFVMETYHDE